jgi:hypothetical protein
VRRKVVIRGLAGPPPSVQTDLAVAISSLHPERITDRQAPVDDLPVLSIFGIQRRASCVERRGRHQRIVDVKLVLSGEPQARLMSLNRQRHWLRHQSS